MREEALDRPDRKTFVEFQERNRRATWKLTATCALVVGGAGVLSAFGFIGLFLGPIVLGLVVALFRFATEELAGQPEAVEDDEVT